MEHDQHVGESNQSGSEPDRRRPYHSPAVTFEGTLDELTLVPTFCAASYVLPPQP